MLTHYQMTNFRLFQTERVCRQQFQIWRKWQKDIQMGRKHFGKSRNCSLRAISPFPSVFKKACFPGASKGVIVWEWVKLRNKIHYDRREQYCCKCLYSVLALTTVLLSPIDLMSLSIPLHYSMMVIQFPHNNTFWHPWETSLLKTLWEKEKLLVMSNFSFSHSVFYLFG